MALGRPRAALSHVWSLVWHRDLDIVASLRPVHIHRCWRATFDIQAFYTFVAARALAVKAARLPYMHRVLAAVVTFTTWQPRAGLFPSLRPALWVMKCAALLLVQLVWGIESAHADFRQICCGTNHRCGLVLTRSTL